MLTYLFTFVWVVVKLNVQFNVYFRLRHNSFTSLVYIMLSNRIENCIHSKNHEMRTFLIIRRKQNPTLFGFTSIQHGTNYELNKWYANILSNICFISEWTHKSNMKWRPNLYSNFSIEQNVQVRFDSLFTFSKLWITKSFSSKYSSFFFLNETIYLKLSSWIFQTLLMNDCLLQENTIKR